MSGTDQQAVIDFLARPESYPGTVREVRRVDTHISAVFLAGERAYKLKRARALAYLDFTTLEQRRAACENEVRVNRRTAPDLYLGMGAVVRTKDGLRLVEPGEHAREAVDWLVVMRQFRQDDLFDAMARRGDLDEETMLDVADAIARFHGAAEQKPGFGGREGMAKILESNGRELHNAGRGVLDPEAVAQVLRLCEQALDRVGGLLDARRANGFVRHCHGDLHLRNICLFDGHPTLFDAIEFSDDIACIDVLYDLAFLLMDLEERGLRPLANAVLNRYLATTHDYDGLAALPVFLAFRATIRSHVSAGAIAFAQGPETRRLAREAVVYLEHARAFLTPPPARAVAIGGLSGTGKSTLGRELAPGIGPAPGAVHLRSDVIRKELAGVAPLTRLGPKAYRREMTARVYETLDQRAEQVLRAGHGVVADAVFARPDERRNIEAAAARTVAPFNGIWLDAPADVCESRIAQRSGDASDANVQVFRRQQEHDPGEISWHRLAAAGDPGETSARARAHLTKSKAGS